MFNLIAVEGEKELYFWSPFGRFIISFGKGGKKYHLFLSLSTLCHYYKRQHFNIFF